MAATEQLTLTCIVSSYRWHACGAWAIDALTVFNKTLLENKYGS